MDSGTKKPWWSITLWTNAIAAVAALAYPPASEFISAHPQEVALIWSLLNMAIRLITKEKISLSN